MNPARRRLVAIGLVAVAWVSAGAAPLREAVSQVRAPVDFARDYVAAHARVHLGRGAAPADEAGNAYAAEIGAPRVQLLTGPFHLHPPPALLPVLPLVPLGFAGAAVAWALVTLVALGLLARALVQTVEGHGAPAPPDGAPPRRGRWLLLFALLAMWPPVLHNLAKGQWSVAVAALVACGWHALERGRPRAGGALFGAAASLKATPLLLLGFLVARHRRAAGAMIATLAVAFAASIVANGLEPWRAFLADAPRDVAAWQTWTANTLSLGGLVSRLLAGGPFARPLVEAPRLASGLTALAGLTAAAALFLVSGRAPASRDTDRRLFAAWTALIVLLNPLGWTHGAVLALLPAALLVRDPRRELAVLLALAALTIPRQVLAVLAGPLPVSPARGLFLSVHAAAVAALLAVSVPGVRSPARAADLARSRAPR